LLVEFLVAQAGQKLFADLDKEYPLHPDVKTDPALVERKSFHAALVPLAKLAELREPTIALIEEVGLR
jgi:iron(III) transport system substrate-binding protein